MEEKQVTQPKKPAPIDFGAMWTAIKKHRKLYYKVLSVTFVIACIYVMSLPDYYTCKILLAPETGGGSSSLSSISSLASSFGISLGGGGNSGGDAITPTVYPDLMNSTDFKTSLFPVKVKRKTDQQSMSYYDYLKNEWREPWWDHWFGLRAPKKEKDTLVNNFELTGEQSRIAGMINKNVDCKIDKKTNLISINVTAQDPHIAAQLADSVKTRLQDFLTEYKTSKARHDLEYALMLQRQAKKDYEHARRLYVEFMDANQDMVLLTAQQKQNDLENEMQLQYNNYTAISAQVIAAKAKVQEVTPAFTPLQSATVPLAPAGPKRGRLVFIFLLLSTLLTTIWILKRENQLKPLFGLS